MVFKATFKQYFSYIVAVNFIGGLEETGLPKDNHWPVTSHCYTLSQNVVLSSCKSNYHSIPSWPRLPQIGKSHPCRNGGLDQNEDLFDSNNTLFSEIEIFQLINIFISSVNNFGVQIETDQGICGTFCRSFLQSFGSDGPVVLRKTLKCEKCTDRRQTRSDDKSSLSLGPGKQKTKNALSVYYQ